MEARNQKKNNSTVQLLALFLALFWAFEHYLAIFASTFPGFY